MSDELIDVLASQGNRRLVTARLNARGESTDRAIQAKAIERAILLPLIDKAAPQDSVTACLELCGAPTPTQLDAHAERATAQALDDAWTLCGGPGKRAALWPSIRAAELLDAPIEGGSLYLATGLRALADWSGAQPLRNVLATGEPDRILDAEPWKRTLAELTFTRYLRHEGMLTLARPPVPAEAHVLPVADLAEAAERAFGFVPWHKDADCVRLHIHCGPGRLQAPTNAHWERIELPETLAPEHYALLKERLGPHLRPGQRTEISLAGPVILGAMIGALFANLRPARVLHDGRPFWYTPARRRALVLQAAVRGAEHEHRVALVRENSRPTPSDWLRIALPERQETADAALAAVAEQLQSGRTLHLGLDLPLAVAFAVAATFGNQHTLHYHHYNGRLGAYEPWFER